MNVIVTGIRLHETKDDKNKCTIFMLDRGALEINKDKDFGYFPMVMHAEGLKIPKSVLKNLPCSCKIDVEQISGEDNKPKLKINSIKLLSDRMLNYMIKQKSLLSKGHLSETD